MHAFFLCALISSTVASKQFTVQHGSDVCAWQPFRLVNYLSCPLREEPELVTVDKNRSTQNESSVVTEWRGPHLCYSTYCVYSNQAFANGRGIALITTQLNAEGIAQQHRSDVAAGAWDEFRGVRSFDISEVPGKGLGLIAKRAIRRGEPILASPPAVMGHRSFIDDVPEKDQHRLFGAAVSKLPRKTQEQFLSQMGHAGGHKITDIMFTNSFNLFPRGAEAAHFANFPEVSRFNHDCRPNVVFHINGLLQHSTVAIRDIEEGEELSISYLDSFRVRSVRQDRAHRNWGFNCTCSQCSLPPNEVAASDSRLYDIWLIENELEDWESKKVTAEMIEHLMALYEKERLGFSIAAAYKLAALNFNALGNEELAMKYAQLGLEASSLEKGPATPDIKAMRDLMDDPKRHWTWKRRTVS